MSEADRIVSCMSGMAAFHGTTTADIVDEICANYPMSVWCHGDLRNMVFTPITKNTIAFKTVRAF